MHDILPPEIRRRILKIGDPKNRARYAITSKQSAINVSIVAIKKHERKTFQHWKRYALRNMTTEHALAHIVGKRRKRPFTECFFSYDELATFLMIDITNFNNKNFHFENYKLYNLLRFKHTQNNSFLTPVNPQVVALLYDDQLLIFTKDDVLIDFENDSKQIRYERPAKTFNQLLQRMVDMYNRRVIGHHGTFEVTQDQFDSIH